MKRALIHPERCRSCDPCEIQLNCPMDAIIRESRDMRPWIDFYRCSGCLKCKAFCTNAAVEEVTHPCDGKGRMGW